MKNQKVVWGVVIVVVIIGIIAYFTMGNKGSSTVSTSTTTTQTTGTNGTAADATVPYVTAAQVAQVSATTKKYQNDELGFSVDYPNTWGLQDTATGPIFTIPSAGPTSAPAGGKTTIPTLQAAIYYVPTACAFPPVATSTVSGKTSVTANGNTFKMIKVTSSQGSLSYFDEMYTLDQGTKAAPSCYVFSFASTVASPATQSVASAQVPTVIANNKSIVDAATEAFGSMVKSFAVVQGAAGQSESTHPTGK